MSVSPPRRNSNSPIVVPKPVGSDHGRRYGIEIAFITEPNDVVTDVCHIAAPNEGRTVILAGLRHGQSQPTDVGHQRVIWTTDHAGADPKAYAGWFEPDPLRAVVVATAGLEQGDRLILALPHDWTGPSPQALLEYARRWRSSPHSAEDDVHFSANHPR